MIFDIVNKVIDVVEFAGTAIPQQHRNYYKCPVPGCPLTVWVIKPLPAGGE
jgi:hypothetical protein